MPRKRKGGSNFTRKPKRKKTAVNNLLPPSVDPDSGSDGGSSHITAETETSLIDNTYQDDPIIAVEEDIPDLRPKIRVRRKKGSSRLTRTKGTKHKTKKETNQDPALIIKRRRKETSQLMEMKGTRQGFWKESNQGQPHMSDDQAIGGGAGGLQNSGTDLIKKYHFIRKSQNMAIQYSIDVTGNPKTKNGTKTVENGDEESSALRDWSLETLDTVEYLLSTIKTEENNEDIEIDHEHCDGNHRTVEQQKWKIKCEADATDTIEQLYSNVETEEINEGLEIKIEDTEINHQHCDGNQQIVEQQTCKIECDDISYMAFQNSKYKMEPCLAQTSAFQPVMLHTVDNIQYPTIKTESIDETQEIKIEDVVIDYQEIQELETYRVKSETDDIIDRSIQNGGCKLEGPTQISDFRSAFQPEMMDTVGNIQLYSTESNDQTLEIKIEDMGIDHQYIDEKQQIYEQETYRVKSEKDDLSDMSIQNG